MSRAWAGNEWDRRTVPLSHAFILRGTRTVKLMGGWMGDDLGLHEDEQGTAKRDLGYDIVETRLK